MRILLIDCLVQYHNGEFWKEGSTTFCTFENFYSCLTRLLAAKLPMLHECGADCSSELPCETAETALLKVHMSHELHMHLTAFELLYFELSCETAETALLLDRHYLFESCLREMTCSCETAETAL